MVVWFFLKSCKIFLEPRVRCRVKYWYWLRKMKVNCHYSKQTNHSYKTPFQPVVGSTVCLMHAFTGSGGRHLTLSLPRWAHSSMMSGVGNRTQKNLFRVAQLLNSLEVGIWPWVCLTQRFMVVREICAWKRLVGVSEMGSWAFKRQDRDKGKSFRFRQGWQLEPWSGHLDQEMRLRRDRWVTNKGRFYLGDLGRNETGKVSLVKIMERLFFLRQLSVRIK